MKQLVSAARLIASLIYLVFEDGYDVMRLQCLECRAPEVWRGLGV